MFGAFELSLPVILKVFLFHVFNSLLFNENWIKKDEKWIVCHHPNNSNFRNSRVHLYCYNVLFIPHLFNNHLVERETSQKSIHSNKNYVWVIATSSCYVQITFDTKSEQWVNNRSPYRSRAKRSAKRPTLLQSIGFWIICSSLDFLLKMGFSNFFKPLENLLDDDDDDRFRVWKTGSGGGGTTKRKILGSE